MQKDKGEERFRCTLRGGNEKLCRLDFDKGSPLFCDLWCLLTLNFKIIKILIIKITYSDGKGWVATLISSSWGGDQTRPPGFPGKAKGSLSIKFLLFRMVHSCAVWIVIPTIYFRHEEVKQWHCNTVWVGGKSWGHDCHVWWHYLSHHCYGQRIHWLYRNFCVID